MKHRLLPAMLAFVVVACTGCVTHITTSLTQNPPPAEKLADFTRFELQNVTLQPPYAGQEANEKALVKIQQNVSLKMTPAIAQWTAAVPAGAPVRTLVIEPTVTEIKFINATARVWAGAMAGSSAVILKARLYERETGKTIAEPIFYSKANAWGGAWSFGTTDNLMLTRVADRFSAYLTDNYLQAVGGPTGAEPPGGQPKPAEATGEAAPAPASAKG